MKTAIINTPLGFTEICGDENGISKIHVLNEDFEISTKIPKELKEAARCDDVSEYRIFFQIILPLTRPAIATVAVFTMIPIWNDLWFPLILAPGEETRTLTLGVQQFIGQYVTDWNSVLASLTLAVIPVLILYMFFSRQLIRGLTSGAVK